jgi:hypothetical protein
MMLGIGAEMRRRVPYSVKLRAYLGAGVSAADALSDAYMIGEFYEMGETGAANGLLALVGANVAFQLLVVYVPASERASERATRATRTPFDQA